MYRGTSTSAKLATRPSRGTDAVVNVPANPAHALRAKEARAELRICLHLAEVENPLCNATRTFPSELFMPANHGIHRENDPGMSTNAFHRA